MKKLLIAASAATFLLAGAAVAPAEAAAHGKPAAHNTHKHHGHHHHGHHHHKPAHKAK